MPEPAVQDRAGVRVLEPRGVGHMVEMHRHVPGGDWKKKTVLGLNFTEEMPSWAAGSA